MFGYRSTNKILSILWCPIIMKLPLTREAAEDCLKYLSNPNLVGMGKYTAFGFLLGDKEFSKLVDEKMVEILSFLKE